MTSEEVEQIRRALVAAGVPRNGRRPKAASD